MPAKISKDRPVVEYGFKRDTYSRAQHTFGNPESYLRIGKALERPTREEAHYNIRQTLLAVFDRQDPNSIIKQVSERLCLAPEDIESVQLDFINWGNLQLVYLAVLSVPTETVHLVLLINQPQIPLGQVKAEFDNLQRLAEIDLRYIVEPYVHFAKGSHELYASPYVEGAQCIFSGYGYQWGVWNPNPHYPYETFSDVIRSSVTSSMIALLINYYDAERGRGLAQTHLSGDDFILTQDFKHDDPASVLPNMRLIAARGWVEAPLEGYIEIIRQEFLVGTHYRDDKVVQGEIIVNHKSGLPLNPEEINVGIELGMRLRE